MNKEEKIGLILEDERNRIEEERSRLNLLMNGPAISSQSVDDDYQYRDIPQGATGVEVFILEVPDGKALIIDYIANDWYPDVEFDFIVDGSTPMGKIERETAPTNDPTEVNIICKDRVRWLADNHSNQGRIIGVVTGGRYVPEKIYHKWVEMYE